MKTFTRILILFFLCIPFKSLSVTKGPLNAYGYHFMQFFYHTGMNFGPTRYLKEQYTWGSRAYELRFGFQSQGDELWQQYHRLPQYGLGIHYADLIANKKDTTIGNPISVFMFFNAPFIRWSRFTLSTSLSLGLSYTNKCHDPVRNPYNDVIGSCVNLYFDTNLNLDYRMSHKINLIMGIGLTHYSNGAIQHPQMGMNTIRINMGLSYNLYADRKEADRDDRPIRSSDKPTKRKEDPLYINTHETLQFMFAMGIVDKQRIGEFEDRRYATSSFTADYAFPLTPINNLTFGLDMLYNESLNRSYPGIPPEEVSFVQKTYLGSHIGYQVIIQRVTLLVNLGTYFRQSSYDAGFWFLRAGGRIRITDHLQTHICIKTKDGIRSDWIEWGLAYHVRIKKPL